MEKLGYCHRWSIIGPNHFTLQHYMLIVNVKFRTRARGHAKLIPLPHNIWSFWIPMADGDCLNMALLKSMRKLYRPSRKS